MSFGGISRISESSVACKRNSWHSIQLNSKITQKISVMRSKRFNKIIWNLKPKTLKENKTLKMNEKLRKKTKILEMKQKLKKH